MNTLKAKSLGMFFILMALTFIPKIQAASAADGEFKKNSVVELSADTVRDKIRGGLLGQLLGDLNGLQYEFKFIDAPGNVKEYTSSLPEGAWTDDDTDFEWVYVVAMEKEGKTLLPPSEIAQLWRRHINRKFWCANQYARMLMELGMAPPQTGMLAFNPWSDFNLAGQFNCETWGLIAPGMPATASRIGLHYAHVAVEGEPTQATQLFDTMIATAFLTDDLDKIIDAGLGAMDTKSELAAAVRDAREWHRQNPADWRATWKLLKSKYAHYNMAMRDRNGVILNSSAVVAALLYGEGDFVKSILTSWNFGWDCDCNAATVGTILGVLKGGRWIMSQGWDIKDVYKNTTRDEMPNDETITRFGDRLIALAERNIKEQGGEVVKRDGKEFYRIQGEQPVNQEQLGSAEGKIEQIGQSMRKQVEAEILGGKTKQEQARAAYQAICLDLAGEIRKKHPEQWAAAIEALKGYHKVVSALFYEAGTPRGNALRLRAVEAGLRKPERKLKIW